MLAVTVVGVAGDQINRRPRSQMGSAATTAIWSLRGKGELVRTSRLWMRRSCEAGRCKTGEGRQRSFASRIRGTARLQFAALRPPHNLSAVTCYCVRNLYVTIRATMLAKISSAGRDFRIIDLVDWSPADRPG